MEGDSFHSTLQVAHQRKRVDSTGNAKCVNLRIGRDRCQSYVQTSGAAAEFAFVPGTTARAHLLAVFEMKPKGLQRSVFDYFDPAASEVGRPGGSELTWRRKLVLT